MCIDVYVFQFEDSASSSCEFDTRLHVDLVTLSDSDLGGWVARFVYKVVVNVVNKVLFMRFSEVFYARNGVPSGRNSENSS